jgi:hypothetical protein
MTLKEKAVKDIAAEIYDADIKQILIDFVQETVEPILNKDPLTSEDVGAAHYNADILLEAYNPEFKKDIDILTRLENALGEWQKDIEETNKILGLPPCN